MNQSDGLEFTGERFTPECVREIAYEHWHRYAWAAELVAGKSVIDVACGEGYGSQLLARQAARVTGFDLSELAVDHARRRYADSHLDFAVADCARLPIDDDSVDAVVSFETLEHVEHQEQMLAEFRRVLRPRGILLISSPDRRTYSDQSGFKNPHHVRELYRGELEALVGRHFPAFRLYEQKLLFVSAIWQTDRGGEAAWHTAGDSGIERSDRPSWAPLYYLVIAADDPADLPEPAPVSLYGDRDESVYRHYNEEVRKHIRAGQLLAERDAEIADLRRRLQAAGID